MKYHNFKRPLAVMLAALLTLSAGAFTAIAQEADETSEITYTLRGGSSNGDGTGNYVVELLANGGLINTGYVELSYDAEVYKNVTFDFADNVRDAGFYWGIGEQASGKFAVGFMSNAVPEGQDGTLFADINNPSDTLAYIDASGDDLVRIGSFTLDFISSNYADSFNSENTVSVKVEDAKAILHTADEFNVSQVDCDYTVSNTLVFSSTDFVVSNNVVPYIAGIGQSPNVASDVADTFGITLGDEWAYEVIDAGTYTIKVLNVSGEGYYDAEEIVHDKSFVIERGTGYITKPANPEAVDFVPENGFDPKELEIENWEVTDSDLLGAGTHTVNVKYTGTLDKNVDYEAGEDVNYNEETKEFTSTVSLVVNPLEGSVPAIENEYSATYDKSKAQTIAGYGIELPEGWVWENGSAELGMTAITATAIYTPEDAVNYDYSAVEGWDATTKTVKRTASIVLTKAKGTAPEAPAVIKTSARLDKVGGVIAVSEFVTLGDWVAPGDEYGVGEHTVSLTYNKDIDTTHYTYETSGDVIWDSDNSCFTFTVVITVDKPYLDLVTPASPEAKDYAKDTTYKYSDFALPTGWSYATPDAIIANAGTVNDVKVLYMVDDAYDVNPKDGFTVEEIENVRYIASTVSLTVNKIAGVVDVPNVAAEMLAGTVLSGNADDNGWKYVDITIAEGINTVTVTKTILAATANNYDYTDAALAAGVVIETADNGDVTFTKTYTVTGRIPAGHISFEALAIQGVTVDDTDVSVKIIPEQGEAFELEHDSEGHIIFAEDYKLNEGKYSISIKKAKYLETVITFELSDNQKLDLGQIVLVPGDIVGGPEGSETDGDGVIDIDDFVIGVRAFDSEVLDIVKSAADIDKNGANNVTDLGFIKANFGKSTAKDCTITVE